MECKTINIKLSKCLKSAIINPAIADWEGGTELERQGK